MAADHDKKPLQSPTSPKPSLSPHTLSLPEVRALVHPSASHVSALVAIATDTDVEGAWVRSAVGEADGELEGNGVTAAVTTRVGLGVGWSVGREEGDIEGNGVTAAVTTRVGLGVGWSVGGDEGDIEGNGVTAAVTTRVGLGVG